MKIGAGKFHSRRQTSGEYTMGGPIVRTGTTPAFWANWEKAFGKAAKSGSAKSATAKKPAKSNKAKAAAKPKKKKK
jgi:hypothetical protein